jgi:hypothetical protein
MIDRTGFVCDEAESYSPPTMVAEGSLPLWLVLAMLYGTVLYCTMSTGTYCTFNQRDLVSLRSVCTVLYLHVPYHTYIVQYCTVQPTTGEDLGGGGRKRSTRVYLILPEV